MLQSLIGLTCVIVTLNNCRLFIWEYEMKVTQHNLPNGKLISFLLLLIVLSMWSCFIPLLILAALYATKIVSFNVVNPILSATICVSIVSIPFCIESYFDHTQFDAPLWVTALPFCLIMLQVAFTQFIEVFSEKDHGTRLYKGLDLNLKRTIVVINMVSIASFAIAIVVSLYFLSQTHTNA